MCPSWATCLSVNCCFSELALYKSNSAGWSSTKRTSSSYHLKLTCSCHNLAENCWIGVKQQSLTHSLTHSIVHISMDKMEWSVILKCLSITLLNRRSFIPLRKCRSLSPTLIRADIEGHILNKSGQAKFQTQLRIWICEISLNITAIIFCVNWNIFPAFLRILNHCKPSNWNSCTEI
jgi:hypothetical protein